VSLSIVGQCLPTETKYLKIYILSKKNLNSKSGEFGPFLELESFLYL
jgi:hypothetical protein